MRQSSSFSLFGLNGALKENTLGVFAFKGSRVRLYLLRLTGFRVPFFRFERGFE